MEFRLAFVIPQKAGTQWGCGRILDGTDYEKTPLNGIKEGEAYPKYGKITDD